MTCSEYLELVNRYVAYAALDQGKLKDSVELTSPRADQHIQTCGSCRAAIQRANDIYLRRPEVKAMDKLLRWFFK